MTGFFAPTDLRTADPRPSAQPQTLADLAAATVLSTCPEGADEVLRMLGIDGPLR